MCKSNDQDLDSSAQDEVDKKTESLLTEFGWKKNSQTGKWMPPVSYSSLDKR